MRKTFFTSFLLNLMKSLQLLMGAFNIFSYFRENVMIKNYELYDEDADPHNCPQSPHSTHLRV